MKFSLKVFSKRFRKTLRVLRSKANDNARGLVVIVLGGLIILGVFTNTMTRQIDPKIYRPLLDTIAKGESKGNYNAYFGNAGNQDVKFTEMTIEEVVRWQEAYVAEGSVSSAVGKYQIIRPTLNKLVTEMELDPQTKFTEELQDQMAVKLLEKRGAADFVNQKLSHEQFAANLAKEWAALPKITDPNPEQSYYAGDGINKALLTIDEVNRALDAVRQVE